MTPSPTNPAPRPAGAIDFAAIRDRLDRARSALTAGAGHSPEERQRVLHARAQALARPPQQTGAADAWIEIVEFTVAGETYAFETTWVQEVFPLDHLTPVPCTPPFVLGIVNLRGQILSIIDLKRFFDLPEAGLNDLNRVIVLARQGMSFGVLADAVRGTRRLPLDSLQPSLPTLIDIRQEYLRGVTGDRLVVLDAARLLADPQLIVHEEVER